MPMTIAEHQRIRVARNRAEFFSGRVCVDCGTTERLELDHVDPKLKISHKIWGWSKVRREVELAKCVPRCNACHHKKTHKDLGWGAYAKHGTPPCYNRGCRCDLCRGVNAGRSSMYRAIYRERARAKATQ
jgi:hypothetical protein